MPLHDALFVETNPGPVKYAAWRLGVIGSPDCRLPLAPLTEATKKASTRRWRASACCRRRPPNSAQRPSEPESMAAKKDDGRKRIAENRKARFEYRIEDT